MLRRKGVRHGGRSIRRAVIDDDNFNRAIGLPENARDRLAQEFHTVVHRNNGADQSRDDSFRHYAARYFFDHSSNNSNRHARLLKMLTARGNE